MTNTCYYTNEPIVSFLYELMRDYLPVGTVQKY